MKPPSHDAVAFTKYSFQIPTSLTRKYSNPPVVWHFLICFTFVWLNLIRCQNYQTFSSVCKVVKPPSFYCKPHLKIQLAVVRFPYYQHFSFTPTNLDISEGCYSIIEHKLKEKKLLKNTITTRKTFEFVLVVAKTFCLSLWLPMMMTLVACLCVPPSQTPSFDITELYQTQTASKTSSRGDHRRWRNMMFALW